MICTHCRMNTHGHCDNKREKTKLKGSWCDCQHKPRTGNWINRKLVPDVGPRLDSDDAAARGLGAT